MKLKSKIAILLVAILVTFIQFNWIVCSTCCVDILEVAKKAGYERISTVQAAP
jgi:hypothetical protein